MNVTLYWDGELADPVKVRWKGQSLSTGTGAAENGGNRPMAATSPSSFHRIPGSGSFMAGYLSHYPIRSSNTTGHPNCKWFNVLIPAWSVCRWYSQLAPPSTRCTPM